MKKEFAAAALLLALIAAAIYNIHWLDGFIGGICGDLALSRTRMVAEDFAGAEDFLSDAIDKWMDAEDYTHIFIRHSEINSTTDAFYEALGDVVSHDAAAASGSFGKLSAQLESITGIEHIRFGSVF